MVLSIQSSGDSAPEETAKDHPLSAFKRGRETILFVEDEESLRSVVGDFLTQFGYRVLTATNGRDALDIATAHEGAIDLLLTDVIMPQMSGPELARKIRATRPEMKVMYISGYSESILEPFDVNETGTALLQKPFTIRVLAAKLQELLNKKQLSP